jgi:hypothetical protein
LGEAASFTIGLRGSSDGFGFKLIPKRDQPSLYIDVTDRKRKLAAPLGFIAWSFDLRHPASISALVQRTSNSERPLQTSHR